MANPNRILTAFSKLFPEFNSQSKTYHMHAAANEVTYDMGGGKYLIFTYKGEDNWRLEAGRVK